MAKADKAKSVAKKKVSKTASVKARTPVATKKKSAGGGAKSAAKEATPQAAKRKTVAKSEIKPQKSKSVVQKTKVSPKTTITESVKKTGAEANEHKAERNIASTEELRALLLSRRNGILENIDRDISSKIDSATLVGDVADLAHGSSENELTFQLAEAESRELGQVDKALEKIDEGTYGICEICNENISLSRLKALPFANKCIRCQEADEQGLSYRDGM